MLLQFIQGALSVVYSFLLFSNIPLCGCTTVHVYIHYTEGHLSYFWLLAIMNTHLCIRVLVDINFHFLNVNMEEWF